MIYATITRLLGQTIADAWLSDLRSYREWTGAEWELELLPGVSGMAGDVRVWRRKG